MSKSSNKSAASKKTRGHRVGAQPGAIRSGQEDHYVGEVPMMAIGQKLIGGRSLLAIEFLTVTDAFTRDITDIVVDPGPLAVNVRGEMKEWKPDYMFAHKDGRRDLVTVRMAKWLTRMNARDAARQRDLVDGMQSAAARKGQGFRLVTEEQVFVEPRLYNAKLLRRHLAPFRSDHDETKAIEALGQLPKASSVAALQSILGKTIDAFVAAIRLDWLGHLELDRETKFSRGSTFVKT